MKLLGLDLSSTLTEILPVLSDGLSFNLLKLGLRLLSTVISPVCSKKSENLF